MSLNNPHKVLGEIEALIIEGEYSLALEKQLPVEDTEFLESIQKNSKDITDPYVRINKYFTEKYGSEFGPIYLAAITGGEEKCTEVINNIEKSKAEVRIRKETFN